MAKLILRFKDRPISSFTLHDGATITIGRHSGNDIVIDNLVISGMHAHVERRGQVITLTDLQSKNGSYLNGEQISQAVLRHGDVVTVGKHTLLVDMPDHTEPDGVRVPSTDTGTSGENPPGNPGSGSPR